MPEVLDWQRVADPHAIIHYAVQALRQGRTVAFPTETGYVLTASALVPEAVRKLHVSSPGTPVVPKLTLALRGPAEARDWAPGMSPLTQRLARRLWPGSVTLIVRGDVEQGLAGRLAEEVRTQLCSEGTLRVTTASHDALREVLRHLPGPLLLTEATSETRAEVIIDDGQRGGESATVVAVNGDGWQIVEPGVVSEEEIRQQTACLLLFICTGNTCRSPLAEALCKKLLADRIGCSIAELAERGYHVLSAGVAATRGGPAAAEAEKVAAAYGADLSAHRSQPLTPELALRADYLIGMTRSHLGTVLDYFGHLGVSPRLLNPAGDVADPIGCAQPIYDECGQQIWHHLEALIAEILPAGA